MDNTISFLVFFIGACFGSFANVIIYRLPKGQSIVRPRSHCFSCKKQISAFDNIPILSWFLLRGKCRHCGSRFSVRYALVELIMASLFLAVHIKFGFTWLSLEYLVMIFGLVTASVIDLDHTILPDEFTIGGLILGLIGAAINPMREFLPAFYGVLLGGGFLWATAVIYLAIRKQEGMGGGDIKLMAWIGSILGWTSVPFVILTSSTVGTIFGLVLIARSKGNLQKPIPFGPYIAFGAILYLFFGEEITEAYWRIFVPSL